MTLDASLNHLILEVHHGKAFADGSCKLSQLTISSTLGVIVSEVLGRVEGGDGPQRCSPELADLLLPFQP